MQSAIARYTPLLTAAEMRAAEAKLFQRIPSWEVMQCAGHAVSAYILAHFSPQKTMVCCGPGNNGGDGFIIAQDLLEAGWPVQLVAARTARDYTGDARNAALTYHGDVLPLSAFNSAGVGLIVDAVFGIGLSKELAGEYVQLVAAMQAAHATRVAVDIPSGVQADTGEVLGVALRADVTITFGAKKRGQVLMPGLAHVGKLVVADIGLSDADIIATAFENTRPNFPQASAADYKYTRGNVLVLGGPEMTGAARLAALASARAGAGMVRVAAPASAYEIYATSLLSILVKRMDSVEDWRTMLADSKLNAVCMGAGAGIGDFTKEALGAALETALPLVLDADALTVLAQHSALQAELQLRGGESCITPHEGEYKRLALSLKLTGDADKITRAQAIAAALKTVVVLKGADTVIAAPDGRAVVNTNAPPWLATAGSGDVLAGIITALAAQGIAMFDAACAGVWLHGEAANRIGAGLMAEDLLEAIPRAMH